MLLKLGIEGMGFKKGREQQLLPVRKHGKGNAFVATTRALLASTTQPHQDPRLAQPFTSIERGVVANPQRFRSPYPTVSPWNCTQI
jgi:hypothetical protein